MASKIQETLDNAWAELKEAQSVSSFTKDGITVQKQRIEALQANIEWLQKQLEDDTASDSTGIIKVIL